MTKRFTRWKVTRRFTGWKVKRDTRREISKRRKWRGGRGSFTWETQRMFQERAGP